MSKVVLQYNQEEYEVEITRIQNSGLVKELMSQPIIYNQPIKIAMPKWVIQETFDLFCDYLREGSFVRQGSDQALQRLLWLGDHLQIDELQGKIISEVILQRIDTKNCILFLNEAFKKLKACEDSSDIWYMLLNTCMNFAAKNLLIISQTCQKDLAKINPKICEEILDRSIKYHKKKNTGTLNEFLDIIFQLKGCKNVVELINYQKKLIRSKKINFTTHPSINWKLSNLSSILNKETQIFKFSDYSWKLVAKMEKMNTLVIYLKLEDNGEDTKTKIVSLYFLLSLNKQNDGELTPQHIVVEKGSIIPLCEFKDSELHQYDEQKLEFTVYLNADQTLTTAINYLYLNLEQVMQLYPVNELDQEDVLVLLKATPQVQKAQDQGLLYLLNFLPKVQYTQIQQEQLLDSLNYQIISQEFLDNCIAQSNGFIRQKLQLKKDRPSQQQQQKKTSSSRVLESRGRNLNQSDRSFVDQMQNRTINEIETNNSSMMKGQSVDRNDISILRDMPLNKLEKLKKNSASNTRIGKSQEPRGLEAPQSQKLIQSPADRKRALMNEINIVNFLKVPSLYKELNDVMSPFLK